MNRGKESILNIADNFYREALAIKVVFSQSARTVVSALEDLKYWCGRHNKLSYLTDLNSYPTIL
jgi:hypothetical protein